MNNFNKKARILSVDVLRGFDMFWIIGGEIFFSSLFILLGGKYEKYLEPQMHHTKWAGFTFYDFIFPLFVFIVGMSVVFSLQKFTIQQDYKSAYKRIFKRFIILFLLGILYHGGLSNGLENLRLMGVLQRLAITYLITSILFLNFNVKTLILLFIIIILGYWAFLNFVPVPELGYPTLEYGKNWVNWFDQHYLPFRMHKELSDPEGILSTIPAVASSLLGLFTSLLLINKKIEDKKKATYFILGGLVITILGYLWGIQFPIIKKIWTSSYVLVSGGYSILLFGILYLILDVWKIKKWATPFIWIGMNSIFIYMFVNIVWFGEFAERFVGTKEVFQYGEDLHNLLIYLIMLGLHIGVVKYLYDKKIFFKI